VEDPYRFYRSAEKQKGIQKFEIRILQRRKRIEIRNSPAQDRQEHEILDTDFHRCTQIQKLMNLIAFGEKKTDLFLPTDNAALNLPPPGGPKIIYL
jgi:hypothetical protein